MRRFVRSSKNSAGTKSFPRRIRSGNLWRRAGRVQRGRLWRFGGTEDGCDRTLCGRRPGRQQSQDRELSGISEGISGADLAERAREQACRFGAEILVARAGIRGEVVAGKGIGYLDDGTKIIARASVCATGVDYRRLGLPNEDRLFGAGVYYGAGASEAMLCSRQEVYLVGGGNSAGQAALHFARYAARVNMVVREDSLKAYMSDYLIDRIRDEPKVNVLTNTEVTALHGDRMLQAITLRNNKTGKEWTAETGWLFLCLGGVPQTQWAAEAGVICDSGGYIITGPDLLRDGKPPRPGARSRPPRMETSLPGVFAAGDVRHGSIKRFAPQR